MDEPVDCRDLAAAQGKLVMFVASLLQRAGVAPMGEFAELLGAFAQTVSESEPAEGQLLGQWAAAVRAMSAH